MTFWLIALGMTIAVALLVLLPLIRAGGTPEGPEVDPDMQVYRDQLAEVDNDLARGVMSEDEAQRIRTEVARRLLEADKAAAGRRGFRRAPRAVNIAVTIVGIAVVLGGSAALYRWVGSPGYPDLPLAKRDAILAEQRANRPTQEEIESQVSRTNPALDKIDPKYVALVEKLRKAVARRPNDLRGQELLTQHEARLGNFVAAHKAKAKVISIKGKDATADDYADLAELMIVAANGYVSPKAEQALADALKRDPRNPRARYYSGLFFLQTDRPDKTYALWSGLLDEGPPNAPWIRPIRGQIAEVARLAGIRPPVSKAPFAGGAPGPTAEQMQAASQMSASDRQDMIKSMVGRLSDRLASEGGTPGEWVRLIRAYGVLGDKDKAAQAFKDATAAYGQDSAAMQQIKAAAQGAGVAE